MNHRERFVRALTGREVDRVPFIKVFGGTNAIAPHWEKERPGIGSEIDRILRFEGEYRGWQIAPVNLSLCGLPAEEVLRDDGFERIVRKGDGSVEQFRNSDFGSHVLEFAVKTRDDWQRIQEGDAPIVIGARSAVFAPVKDLGLIVLDEEHETSYKQEHAPRYHAREVAAKRGEWHHCPLVLASATPSFSASSRARIVGSIQSARSWLRSMSMRIPILTGSNGSPWVCTPWVGG